MIKCGLVKAAGAFGLIICGHARRDKRGCAPPVSSTWTVAGGLWAWHHPCQLLGVGDCGRHRGALPHRATSACHEPLCHGCCCSQASGNQTNKNKQGASTAQTLFTAGSLTSHRQKIWKQCKVWWPTGGGGGGCIKKFECFALCGRRPQVWSPSKQLLVRSNRPQHLATDKGVILCAPLRSGYEGLFVKIRTRVRQTLP